MEPGVSGPLNSKYTLIQLNKLSSICRNVSRKKQNVRFEVAGFFSNHILDQLMVFGFSHNAKSMPKSQLKTSSCIHKQAPRALHD